MSKLRQRDLADALGVSPSLVTRLKARGMPVHSVEAAVAWRDVNLSWRRSKGVRLDTAAAQMHTDPPSQVAVPLTGATVWENRARREAAEADLAEIRLAELRASLVKVDDVRSSYARRVLALRDSLLQLSARLAPVVTAESDQARCQALIDAELRQVLQMVTEDSQ
jgi:hypothetical protein